MKLTELKPKVFDEHGTMTMDCPKCQGTEDGHRLGVNQTWGDLTQSFDIMTLVHSIRVVGRCEAHFCVNNGEIVWA